MSHSDKNGSIQSSCYVSIEKLPLHFCPEINFLIYANVLSFLNCLIMGHQYLAKIFPNVG